MKSEIGVSSFFGGTGFGTAKVCDGLGRDSGSAIWDSSSNGFFSTSSVVFSKILVSMLLPELAYGGVQLSRIPPEAVLRCFKVFLSRPI